MFSFSGEKFLDLLARLVCFLGICVGGMSSIAPNKGISSQEENIIPKCLLLQSLCFSEQGPTDFDTGARKKKFANLIYKLALAGIRFWCAWVLAWTCSPTVSLECRSSGRNKRFGQCRSPARCRPRVNGKTLKFLISSCYFWWYEMFGKHVWHLSRYWFLQSYTRAKIEWLLSETIKNANR